MTGESCTTGYSNASPLMSTPLTDGAFSLTFSPFLSFELIDDASRSSSSSSSSPLSIMASFASLALFLSADASCQLFPRVGSFLTSSRKFAKISAAGLFFGGDKEGLGGE